MSEIGSLRSRSRSSRTTTTNPAVVSPSFESQLIPQRVTGLPTLDDVNNQVSFEVAISTISKAHIIDGMRVGVRLVMSKTEDETFLRKVAGKIHLQLLTLPYLFVVAAYTGKSAPTTLIICGSSQDYIQRAVLLVSSKLVGRIIAAADEDSQWVATVKDLGVFVYDEDALWDAVEKAAKRPIDPLIPPTGSRGIEHILAETRAKLQRISALQAFDELQESQVFAPTFLVDIRPQEQREREGGIHGSLIIERNVLEWRFDPRCDSRLSIADRYDLRIIIFCQEGHTSSLAAYSLQQVGLLNATDIIGGYEAWKAAGLPVDLDRGQVLAQPRSLASLAGSVV